MYDRVYRLKQDFPTLTFEINGGIKDIALGHKICEENNLEGCMVGRLAYENPFELMKVDEIFSGCSNYKEFFPNDAEARKIIMFKYADYVEKLQKGQAKDSFGNLIRIPNPSVLVKPIINFYNGEKFSGKYRQFLSDLVKLKDGPLHLVIREAAKMMYEGGFKTKWKGEENYQLEKENKREEKAEKMRDVQKGMRQNTSCCIYFVRQSRF